MPEAPTPSYRFVAQADDAYIDLDIGEETDEAYEHMKGVWHKMYQAVANHHKISSQPVPDWTTWRPHEWSKKSTDDRRKYVAWDGETLAGFLNVRVGKPSHLDQNHELLYIEHLAASPGNKSTQVWRRRLKRVGIALLAYAALESDRLGYEGRIGLHATDESVGFYDTVNDVVDLFSCRTTGVSGLYDRAVEQVYFEASSEGAHRLLSDYQDV